MKKKLNCHTPTNLGKWLKPYWIMRNFIILFFVCNLSAFANGFTQDVALAKYHDATLVEVFESLKEQTGYGILYKESEINPDVRVNMSKENSDVYKVLEEVLQETGLTFKVQDEVIVIFKEVVEESVNLEDTEQEKKILTGKVTDANGIALPGVSVVIKGTSTGVATDIDGNYSIKFEGQNVVLVFSFVGMVAQEIVYNGQSVQNMILSADAEQMAEVVVTGYQTISKERATGSYVTISKEKLEKIKTTSIKEKLEGMATGVLLTTEEGEGGDKIKISIRGISTIRAEQEPLVVVDGFPIETDIDDINPNDIENIYILQDAAAASIWGARAANGVVVITTKKGTKTGKPTIEFSSNISISTAPKLGDLELLNSSDAVDAVVEYYERGLDFGSSAYVNYGGDYSLDPVLRIVADADRVVKLDGRTERTEAEEAEVQSKLDVLRKNNGHQQYFDRFTQNGIKQDYNLSARGGSEYVKYYSSLSYLKNESKYKGDETERVTFTLNNDYKLTKRIKARTGVSFVNTSQDLNGIGLGAIRSFTGVRMLPAYVNIEDDNGNAIPLSYNKFVFKGPLYMSKRAEQGYLREDYSHIEEFENKNTTVANKQLRLNLSIDFDLIKGLKFSTRGMYEYGNSENIEISNSNTNWLRTERNRFTHGEYNELGDRSLVFRIPEGSIQQYRKTTFQSWNIRNQLTFTKDFENHNIVALAGVEIKESSSSFDRGTKIGYDERIDHAESVNWEALEQGYYYAYPESQNFFTKEWSKTGSELKKLSGGIFRSPFSALETRNRYASYYINGAYTYDQKYTLTFSGRIDDSSLFGAKHSANPLWSIGGGWNISEEELFNVSFVDYLKLRATYGASGNIFGSTAHTVLQYMPPAYYYLNRKYASVTSPKNPWLKWETSYTTNLAVDFRLFNKSVWGTVEYYSKKSKDVIIGLDKNSMYGYNTQLVNGGQIDNKGWTVKLAASIGNKLVYTPNINISYNKNEVIKYDVAAYSAVDRLSGLPIEGYSYGTVFGYRWAGLDDKGDPTITDGKTMNEEGSGLKRFTINEDEPEDALKEIGVLSPTLFGGFTNTLAYKGLSLDVFFTFKFGHVYRKPTLNYGTHGLYYKDVADRWRVPGDEAKTDIPAMESAENKYNWLRKNYISYNDNNYENASHVRLRQVSLRYSFPDRLLKNTFIRGVEISSTVRNLGLVWKASGEDLDPDNIPFGSIQGVNHNTGQGSGAIEVRPTTKLTPIYTFGMKITF